MKKVLVGTTVEDISRAGGRLGVKAGAWSCHLMFEKIGTIRAQVLDPEDMVPARAVLVMSLPGPIVFISPGQKDMLNAVSESIGEPGDWILLYRSGAKKLIIQILPGMLQIVKTALGVFQGAPKDEPPRL